MFVYYFLFIDYYYFILLYFIYFFTICNFAMSTTRKSKLFFGLVCHMLGFRVAIVLLLLQIKDSDNHRLCWHDLYSETSDEQEEQRLRRLTVKCKITKIVLYLLNTHQSHKTYCAWSLKNNLQFIILIYLWPWNKVSHQTRYELLDPKQGYYHAKFERPPLNSVC